MAKTRTMYMHTLEERPASYDVWQGHPYLHFVGGRNRARLVPTLGQLRREQKLVQEEAAADSDWSDPARYGYVLVEVPA